MKNWIVFVNFLFQTSEKLSKMAKYCHIGSNLAKKTSKNLSKCVKTSIQKKNYHKWPKTYQNIKIICQKNVEKKSKKFDSQKLLMKTVKIQNND